MRTDAVCTRAAAACPPGLRMLAARAGRGHAARGPVRDGQGRARQRRRWGTVVVRLCMRRMRACAPVVQRRCAGPNVCVQNRQASATASVTVATASSPPSRASTSSPWARSSAVPSRASNARPRPARTRRPSKPACARLPCVRVAACHAFVPWLRSCSVERWCVISTHTTTHIYTHKHTHTTTHTHSPLLSWKARSLSVTSPSAASCSQAVPL